MRSHEARVDAPPAQRDHDTSTRAVGHSTLTSQLAYDDDEAELPAQLASVSLEDADADGDGSEAGPMKIAGGGDSMQAPDGEHDGGERGTGHGMAGEPGKAGEHAAHAEPGVDADGDAADAEGGEPAGERGGERDPAHIAEDGFRDPPVELPHRRTLEQLFGMSFAGVQAHTGRHARQATRALGASAYTVGNRIAFASPNPSREVVAHELAHVVQHDASSGKASGVETAGEHEAEQVEAAVAAGTRPQLARAAQAPGRGSQGFSAAHRRAPNLKASPKFGIGMTFNPPSPKRNTAEKKFSRTLWSPKNPIEIPIGAVPLLNIIVDPSLKVNGTVGAGKARTVRTNWTLDGGLGVGLSYGKSELVAVNAKLNAGVHGGFTYARNPSTWTFAGQFAIDTNFSFGVVIGKVVSHNFNFGHCDIGKLTGIKFEKGDLKTEEMGWEWGKQPQRFFGLIKNAINNAKKILGLPKDAAKKAWGALKKAPGAAFKAAEGFKKFLDKAIPDLTPWEGIAPW
jgi:hypothetical protein